MRVHFLRSALCALAVVAQTASIGSVATGQGAQATVAVVTSAAFPVGVAAGVYDLYAFVVEFPPGSGTPRHVHGGPVVVTVISGELVLQRSVGERILKAGESVIATFDLPNWLTSSRYTLTPSVARAGTGDDALALVEDMATIMVHGTTSGGILETPVDVEIRRL